MSNKINSIGQTSEKIIVANWKMNGSEELLRDFSSIEKTKNNIIMCLPFTLLECAKTILPHFLKVGAQNCSDRDNGALTGEVSASMLKERSISHVILGHSERRTQLNETDEIIANKINKALDNELVPIICIGETLAEK